MPESENSVPGPDCVTETEGPEVVAHSSDDEELEACCVVLANS
jgi:hypothetical protein